MRSICAWPLTSLICLALVLASCKSDSPSDPAHPANPSAADRSYTFAPKAIDVPTIHNFYQVTPRLFSGSQPEGAESFSRLQQLGVKTIISVDGAIPDVEGARAKGIRYIHLPIGYDEVPAAQAAMLAKAMKELNGPVFVHCHHGKHRGPAAVGVCAIADGAWTNEEAVAWMNKAGTSKDYQGLFKSVGEYRKPDAAALAKVTAPLPEKAAVPPLAKAMVDVDERWERLLGARKAGFKSVPNHPDIEPAHEALQLAETYREMARQHEAKARGDDFVARLAKADAEAMALHESLKAWKAANHPADQVANLAAKADVIARSCNSCHVRHRN